MATLLYRFLEELAIKMTIALTMLQDIGPCIPVLLLTRKVPLGTVGNLCCFLHVVVAHCMQGRILYNCFMLYLTQKFLLSSYCPVDPLGNYLAFKTKTNKKISEEL